MLDEVDEDRLGPLQVVDDDDLRPLDRACLEQPAGTRAASPQARLPMTESGSTPIAIRISTSGQ